MIDKDSYFYIYEDHLGGGCYCTDHELDYDELYCEQCGDSDRQVFEGSLWELEREVHVSIAMLRAAREAMGIGKRRKNERTEV